MLAPPFAAGPEAPSSPDLDGSTVPATWTVLIASDRAYYDAMRTRRSFSGPDVDFPDHRAERRIPLAGQQVRIGRRSATRELKPEIDLADPGVSRLHAVLIAAPDGTWSLMDPGSANGTLLNGRAVTIGDVIRLREGDRINLGAWTVITVRHG